MIVYSDPTDPSGVHVCSHVAPARGERWMYANVEWRNGCPPERVEIGGVAYVREDVRLSDSERV